MFQSKMVSLIVAPESPQAPGVRGEGVGGGQKKNTPSETQAVPLAGLQNRYSTQIFRKTDKTSSGLQKLVHCLLIAHRPEIVSNIDKTSDPVSIQYTALFQKRPYPP